MAVPVWLRSSVHRGWPRNRTVSDPNIAGKPALHHHISACLVDLRRQRQRHTLSAARSVYTLRVLFCPHGIHAIPTRFEPRPRLGSKPGDVEPADQDARTVKVSYTPGY